MSEARDNLVAKLSARGLPREGQPFPLATLEEFFTGNEDSASIGANLARHPGIKCFYEVLLELRTRPEVQDVLVEISEFDTTNPEAWPCSDQVYVLASAGREDLEDWLDPLEPDAIVEGFHGDAPPQAPPVGEGMRVWGVWWD